MKAPFMFVLFGSTGDLAQKKIVPALYKLFSEGHFAEDFTLIAFSRRAWNDQEYRNFIRPYIEKLGPSESITAFLNHIMYAEGHFLEESSYLKLKEKIDTHEQKNGIVKKLFYLAVQPEFYESIVQGLADAHLLKEKRERVFVEKPFGNDAQSAELLQATFLKKMHADQLLRIDHYLAKEALIQFVETCKHDNAFEAKMNKDFVASIHVVLFEQIGIEGRGEFYERIGAIRDVGQNHLLEMIAIVLMDVTAHNENNARAKALEKILIKEPVILGQYEGYRNEEEVDPQSNTETYFKLNVESNDPRWEGVPIVLEGGKAMAQKKSGVTIFFKDGSTHVINTQKSQRDAYEILIQHAIDGGKEYFAGFEEVLAAWKILAPILENRDKLDVKIYPPDSNGPTL